MSQNPSHCHPRQSLFPGLKSLPHSKNILKYHMVGMSSNSLRCHSPPVPSARNRAANPRWFRHRNFLMVRMWSTLCVSCPCPDFLESNEPSTLGCQGNSSTLWNCDMVAKFNGSLRGH